MKNLVAFIFIVSLLSGFSESVEARGRGGGPKIGGGGGMKRPSRPSTPSFNRPAAKPSFNKPSFNKPSVRPSLPASRPSLPSNRPSTRPGTRPSLPTTRPSIPSTKPSTRPSIKPSIPTTRPSIKPGDRPTTLPSTRPEIGARPGQRPTTRPGSGNRPSVLPGLGAGAGAAIVTRPGLGDRLERPSQLPERPSKGDRLGDLKDKLERPTTLPSRPDFSNRPDLPNWGDRWDNNWHDRNWYHHHWHHGHWHHWHAGYWADYWWDRYPVLTAFGVTTWAVNRIGWATGYYGYTNPYYVGSSTTYYDYSQPIQIVQSYPETTNEGTTPAPDVSERGLAFFDRAMQEFYDGKNDNALASVNNALKEIPNDTAIHEFRALVLFALGNYEESAATLYAVLSVGPGWDWTTMSSLYPSVDIYTNQLRALEDYRSNHPTESAPRFVLAYHYLTAGHEDAAAEQLEKVVALNPKDELSRNLLLSLNPEADVPKPEVVEPPKPTQQISSSQLVGSWTAKRASDTFLMNLKKNGEFTWTYQPSNGDESAVSGVWAVDEEGILALDMGEEDVMVAQVILKQGQLDFYMLGDTQGAEPLKFTH
ncbi:MAG: hypothetical protein HUJ26_01945 [Planctomycetaceae bacterium]|nr:hypothetical protein [Planctomycetaceae bacterium]